MGRYATRMPEEYLPQQIYGELKIGALSPCGQNKWYTDTLQASLNRFNINPESWEELTHDSTTWNGLVLKGAI